MDRYILSKINHMKRTGLISASSRGIGKNGGAAPDWLVKQQKEEDEKRDVFRTTSRGELEQ